MTDLQDMNAKIAALETKDPSDTIRMTVKELLLLLRALCKRFEGWRLGDE